MDRSIQKLAEKIAQSMLNIELGAVLFTLKFECNESYVKIDETIRCNDTYIVQTASSTVNDDLIELFLIMTYLEACTKCNSECQSIIMPHFSLWSIMGQKISAS